MKKKFTFLIAALMLLVFMMPTMAGWGQTPVDVTLSSGSFNNNVITWTCADGNITIQQLKGSGSNPSSNYISAPRVYKQNILSFVGTNGYTITKIDIKCDGSYYGTTKYAGTVISENNVENNTTALNPTWSTTNGGTHTIATVSSDGLSEIYIQNGHSSDANTQLRITKLTITYKVSGNITATTVTINTDNLTNTDVYVSTAAGSLTASVTETESGDAVSDASVTWTSSDTGVATIDEDGEVTLVAVGTTTITASYADESGVYGSSSATYELTVTSSEPYVQPTTIEITPNYTFWGKTGQFSGSTYSELSGEQDNVTLYWTRGSGSTYANSTAMRFYKDNTLTFTAPEEYEIESIVITMASDYAPNDITFSSGNYSLSGTTGTWTGAAETVTMSRPLNAASYAQISKFTITIALPKVLSSIALSGDYPTTFHVGDAFSHEGMTVTATYDDESTKDVTDDATFSGYNMSTSGNQTVTVSYTEDEVTKTATYGITVNAPATLASITLSGTYPTEFTQGDAFSHEGMTVTATYDDESTKDVTANATFSGYDMSTIGNQTVTVSYTENQVTKTATYGITVNEYVQPTEIEIDLNNTFFGCAAFTTWSSSYGTSFNGTDSGVTITLDKGTSQNMYINTNGIRMYDGNTLTFDAPDGYTIIQIALEGASGFSANLEADGLEDGTWTGSAAQVEITGYTGKNNMTKATVTLATPSTEPSITVAETEIEVDAEGEQGTIEVTYDNFGTGMRSNVVFYTKDGETYTAVATADLETVYPWITASINNINNVAYSVEENEETTSRSAYIRVYAIDNEENEAYSDYITITQAVAPQQFTLTVTLAENVSAIFVFNAASQNIPLIAEGAAGTVQVLEGTSIIVSPDVAEGYALESLIVNNTDVTSQIDESGAYTFTVTGDVTITATAVFNPYVTLTGEQMANMTNHGTTYGTGDSYLKYITIDGYYWEANAYQQSSTSQYLQINTTGSGNPKGSYIKLPVFNGKIEEITCTTNSSDKVLYFNTTNSASNPIADEANSSTSTERTIDLTDVFYQTGYIVSSGSIQITNITVRFSPYQDMTGNTLENIGDDATVSIPANANVTATGLTIPAGSGIIINSGATLTVSGTLTNDGNANNLIIEDGGQLITKSSGVYATVKKNVTAANSWGNRGNTVDGWYFIASPVNGASYNTAITTGDDNDYDLFMLDWTEGKWLNMKDPNNSNAFGGGFTRGTGYLYASEAGNTLSVAGEIQPLSNSNNATVTLTTNGWNLIGNPLTCKVTANCDFCELNGGSAVNNGTANSSIINPYQGIAVYGAAGDVVTFTKPAVQNAAAPGNNSSLNVTLAKKVTSRGEVSTKVVDNAVVTFSESRGLPKFSMLGNGAKLYIPQDDEEYAVAFSNKQGDVSLNFHANEVGSYTINFAGEGTDLKGMYLIDMLDEQEIDLSVEPSYTFIGSPADRSARFKIVFRNTGFENAPSYIFAYQNGTDIIVSGEGELQIFDVMGRMVATQRINGVDTMHTSYLQNGVYVFKLNGMTQKIVVR